MRYSNEVKTFRFEVLSKVAELAFNGTLDKYKDDIPRMIIPGKVAKFRCCVYREREVLRERTKLAMGEPLSTNNGQGKITVLTAACEGCTINRYNVTANCQRCLSKNCISACKFSAITISGRGAYIDPDKCKECGKCAKVCPFNAISDTQRPCVRSCPVDAISMDENRLVKIEYDRCIECGACVIGCPFGALSDMSSIVDVINCIKEGKKVFAMVAPAIEGQFGKATIGMIKSAIKALGFYDCIEVALGADAVAHYEALELKEKIDNNKKMTTSCCPAFFSLIRKHYPKLADNISHTVSPMTATSRYIKKNNPEAVTVFIGPCIAKKKEATSAEDTADYALTFDEIMAVFDAKNIDPKDFGEDVQDGSMFGKGFAQTGGVSAAVINAMKEIAPNKEISCKRCTGTAECKKALTLMNAGKMEEDIIEGMMCEGGCVYGPSSLMPFNDILKNRKALMSQDDKSISQKDNAVKFEGIKMD